MKTIVAEGTLQAPAQRQQTNGTGMANGNGKSKLNKVELLKRKKSPLSLIHDIYRWADEGFDSIPPEYYDLFKWHGFFYRKQTPGYFMLRMRISNGVLNSSQLRAVAEISRACGRGVGDFTTRQNLHLRWITIEEMHAILSTLQAGGLVPAHTGLDTCAAWERAQCRDSTSWLADIWEAGILIWLCPWTRSSGAPR